MMAVDIDTRQAVDSFQLQTDPNETPQPLPNAAQIPLQSFQLPEFPPQAAQLKDLTLTSDIKPTEYSDLLVTPLSPDAIPPSVPKYIESLTLELFSLGYPSPFLTRLSQALPRLRALTLYCHLIDGVGDDSRKDAGEFFHNILVGKGGSTGGLRELHLLDTFSRKGFFSGIGGILDDLNASDAAARTSPNALLRLLEVSYTYRGHSDPGFISRIPGDELPRMLVPSLLAVSLRLFAPEANESPEQFVDDPADVDENGDRIPGKKPQGIIPLHPSHSGTALLLEKLTGSDSDVVNERKEDGESLVSAGPRGLRMLDCTLYTLSGDQLTKILNHQPDLAILAASLLVQGKEETRKSLLDALRAGSKDLETVEIVGVPKEAVDDESVTSSRSASFHDAFPSAADMADLSTCLPHLNNFTMTILRADSFGSVTWTRRLDGEWDGGIAT